MPWQMDCSIKAGSMLPRAELGGWPQRHAGGSWAGMRGDGLREDLQVSDLSH